MKFFCLFLLASLLSHPIQAKNRSETLHFSTFNLKWFGLGGHLWNDPEMEFRENYIKEFIDQELQSSDIIVFTEVTNPELLERILKNRYDCVTYDRGESIRHQRVVTCFDHSKYRAEKYDEDYEIPEVALGSRMQRPASQVKICKLSGSCFLQVIGVHLAAGKVTDKRLEQIGHLSDELKKQNSPLPTVISGDFNSYSKEQSGKEADDIELFTQSLRNSHSHYQTINNTLKTYYYGEWAKTYDHIMVSQDIHYSNIKGYEACQPEPDLGKTFIPYYSFSRYYSDHCPLTATLEVPL